MPDLKGSAAGKRADASPTARGFLVVFLAYNSSTDAYASSTDAYSSSTDAYSSSAYANACSACASTSTLYKASTANEYYYKC